MNQCNEHLLKGWNGNVDIQQSLIRRLHHIHSYISKAKRELGNFLRKAEERNSEPVKQLRKLGKVYISVREIIIMEAIYRVYWMKLEISRKKCFCSCRSKLDSLIQANSCPWTVWPVKWWHMDDKHCWHRKARDFTVWTYDTSPLRVLLQITNRSTQDNKDDSDSETDN